MTCNIELPGAGRSEQFLLQRGGKQGGVETPEVFNILTEAALQPVVVSWRKRRLGFKLDDTSEPPLTHLFWADNVFLFAKSVHEFRIMAQELTDAVLRAGLTW